MEQTLRAPFAGVLKPVSMVLAATDGCVTSADRNGILVTMPRTSVSSSPRFSRWAFAF